MVGAGAKVGPGGGDYQFASGNGISAMVDVYIEAG